MSSIWIRVLLVWITVLSLSAGVSANRDEFKLIGQAKLKWLMLDIYESSVYSKTGNFSPKSTEILFTIRYLRGFSSDQIIRQTYKEWVHLGIATDYINEWSDGLKKIFPDVDKDDELSLLVKESGEHEFFFNDLPVGSVNDNEFAFAFLDIWFSESTSRPKLRMKLLHNSESDK